MYHIFFYVIVFFSLYLYDIAYGMYGIVNEFLLIAISILLIFFKFLLFIF